MKYVIAVDVGGTHITSALVSFSGNLKKTSTIEMKSKDGRKEFVDAVLKSVRHFHYSGVAGIVLSCPGPIDRKEGRILETPNIPLKNTNIRKMIEHEFSLPVEIENDANCFVLGETLFGKMRGFGIVAGLTLGSGVGGGLVVDREIFRGSGNAAEFGKITIDYNDPARRIMNRGGAEEFLSERGLMRIAGSTPAKTPKELYTLAAKGDKKATYSFKKYGELLGIAVANITYATDPQAVVIGGGISRACRFFRAAMSTELKKRVHNPPKIFFSANTRKYALLGAASIVIPEGGIKRKIRTVKKPWGEFRRYSLNRKSTVKILKVKKGGVLSLQSHRKRDELWVALDKGISVEIDGKKRKLPKEECVVIPRNSVHRIMSSSDGARVLEISFGHFDERDIKRYEDLYGRVKRSKG